MAPRLKGRALSVALRAAETRLGAAALRTVAFREYEMHRLRDLPVEKLAPLAHEPRPVQGAQPRQWNDQRLTPPTPATGRVTARALRAAFESGETTPSEVLADVFARVDAGDFGPAAFSPFVTLDRQRAAEHAAAADQRYRDGAPLGPLDGVPIPIKDEVDLKGLPTYGGTAFLSDVHEEDGFAARALFAGGAVIPGKTHTTEWGMSPLGINPNFSMPRNVHRPDHAAGGSSTGTGAAVALGLAPVGLGSDGGGSIRIPASLQGLFGIKPTFGRIGRSGDVFGCGTVSALGPLGQSTSDLVDFLSVAARGRDAGDYACGYEPAGTPPLAAWDLALGRGVKKARIGVPQAEWQDANPEVAAACMDALRALERDGAKLVDVTLPHAEVAQAIGVLSIGPETAAHVCDYAAEFGHLFGGELRLQMAILGSVGADDYLRAQRARAALRASTAAVMRTVDVLALPTLPIVAPKYPAREDRMQVADDDNTRIICRYTFLANLTGYPAGTAPVGLVDGLPVGLQFVGDAWDEGSVLACLAAVERTGASNLPTSPAYRPLLG